MLKNFKFIFILLISNPIDAQKVVKEFDKDSTAYYLKTDTLFHKKIIPTEYQNSIRIALQYYPELKDVAIKFKVKNKLTPLAARPKIGSLFLKPSKRKYVVIISKKTVEPFTSILLKNLQFNSQIGVIGHEIAHISFYNQQKGIYFIKLILMHLYKKAIDRFEYNTDKRCIEHGLGYQLLSWSSEVRTKLNLSKWKGIRNIKNKGNERYMNPENIYKEMTTLAIYN